MFEAIQNAFGSVFRPHRGSISDFDPGSTYSALEEHQQDSEPDTQSETETDTEADTDAEPETETGAEPDSNSVAESVDSASSAKSAKSASPAGSTNSDPVTVIFYPNGGNTDQSPAKPSRSAGSTNSDPVTVIHDPTEVNSTSSSSSKYDQDQTRSVIPDKFKDNGNKMDEDTLNSPTVSQLGSSPAVSEKATSSTIIPSPSDKETPKTGKPQETTYTRWENTEPVDNTWNNSGTTTGVRRFIFNFTSDSTGSTSTEPLTSSSEDKSQDSWSGGDDGAIPAESHLPETKKPEPADTFNYHWRPTREQQLARAKLVENTPADQLYYSHPNPLSLRYPDYLQYSDDPTLTDREKALKRDVRALEIYHDLEEGESLPDWMIKVIESIYDWPSTNKLRNPFKEEPATPTGKSGTVNSDSTGTVRSGQYSASAWEQPGEYVWKVPTDVDWDKISPSALAPYLFQQTVRRPLKVFNPDPHVTPKKTPPTAPKKATPKSGSLTNGSPKSSKSTPDFVSPSKIIRPFPTTVTAATTTVTAKKESDDNKGSGFSWQDLILLLLLLGSLVYAYQWNLIMVGGYGGYINGGCFGNMPYLTFVSWFHFMCATFPSIYFGARLAGFRFD